MPNRPFLENNAPPTQKQFENLRRALDASSIVAFTDVRGRITFVNEKFCEISKYDEQELLGQDHRILNSGYHQKEFFIRLWKTISSGKVWTGEIRNRAKDGTFYWVFTTIVPLFNEQGKPDQYVAIRTDITELKRNEERLEEERLKVVHAEKMASLGEMAAGIAHELGNPLAVIRGRLELAQMAIERGKESKEDLLKTLQSAVDVADRIHRIIRGMRSFARDGSQDPMVSTSIHRMIQDILEISGEKLRRAEIDLQLDGIDDSLRVECRETQICQVIANLVNNARDAMKG